MPRQRLKHAYLNMTAIMTTSAIVTTTAQAPISCAVRVTVPATAVDSFTVSTICSSSFAITCAKAENKFAQITIYWFGFYNGFTLIASDGWQCCSFNNGRQCVALWIIDNAPQTKGEKVTHKSKCQFEVICVFYLLLRIQVHLLLQSFHVDQAVLWLQCLQHVQ